MYRSLTDNQRFLLKALVQHKVWYDGCGWVWAKPSVTKKMLDVFVKRGFAVLNGSEYHPTETANRTFSK
jgi:hypothetical protein